MTVNMPPAGNVPRSLMQYAPPVSLEAGPDDFDLGSGFRLIRRRIVMIVTLSVLLTAAAIPLIGSFQPVYYAVSRLMIHPPLAATLAAGGAERGNTFDLASEIERLRSRGIAERVISDLKLDERKEFNPALRTASFSDRVREKVHAFFNRGKTASARPEGMELIIPEYYRALSVQRDGGTAVVQIGFSSHDPELAAAVPNRMIGIYLEERQAGLRNRLASALAWVSARVDEQRRRAGAAREAVAQYGKATGIASEGPDEQGKAVMELSARQAKIAQSRAEVTATISALTAAANTPESLSGLVVPDSIGNLERDLRHQQLDLARLLRTYGDNAEEVVALRTKILRTQGDLGVERERYLQAQRARLTALDRQETAVQAELQSARLKLSGDTLAQAGLTRLQRAADREQAALDKLEEQRRTLAGEAALPGVEAEILSSAAVPLLPQGHGRMFYLIAAMLLSACVAVTAAFIREMMDKSVRSHDQLEAVAGVMPAGFIPLLSRREGRSLPVFSGHSQGGMFGEAIRTTILSLAQSNGGRFPNSVVVTSAHGGEGKSFVARSLAIELAATGQQVLLVDGDLRRGNLGSLFKPGSKQGLNEFLSGGASLGDIVHYHSRTGIAFIPRGDPGLDRRPDLAGMAEILEFARSNSLIAIFDSAPVLASTDTVQMTTLTERTVMVVQWAKTGRHAVEYALRSLKSVSSSNVLVAINKVRPGRHALYGFTDSELFSKSLKKYRDMTL